LAELLTILNRGFSWFSCLSW